MAYSIISTLIKILLIGVVMAIELSVALPIVSLAILFLLLRDIGLVGKISMLLITAVIMSSFTGLAWSVVFLTLSLCWLGVEIVRGEKSRVRNRILLMSFVATLVISWSANMHISLRTLAYSGLFAILAVLCVHMFAQQRSRHRLIEWISPGM